MCIRKNIKVAIVIFVGILSDIALADVNHNSDFPISGLSIQALIEPADSTVYHHLIQSGCLAATEQIGFPKMPYKAINFVIPANEEVTGITINDTIKQDLGDTFFVFPTQPPRKLGDPLPEFIPPDSAAYSSNSPYPGTLVEVIHTAYFSGYQIITVRLNPIQYTPAIKKLVFYSKIIFTVHTQIGINKGVPVNRRSPIVQARMTKLARSLVENPGDVEGQRRINVEKKLNDIQPLEITALPSIEGSGVDYVIITNEELRPIFQSLADWKTKKGVISQTRTIEWINNNYSGCDLQEKIRSFIKDAYSYWGIGYVLLAGDTKIIPERKARGWIPSDLYYSDLEGNWNANGNNIFGEDYNDGVDLCPDLAVGRASVETIEEANTFVAKVLTYEKNPTTDYLTKMLFMAEYEPGTSPPSPWFAEHAQFLYPDSTEGTSFPTYFSKYELYAPKDDTIGEQWFGDNFLMKDNVIDAINNGFHLIWHVDHCSQYSFGTGRNYNADPQRFIFKSDATNLANGNKTSILWTLGCDPNAFNYESISESFMNSPNGGTVAFIGNTVYGQFGYEWQGNWIFRSLFHYNIWNLGDAFRSVQGAYGNYFGAYNQNLLGDPEMMVWDSLPGNLNVAHPDTFWLPESVLTVVVKDLAPSETAIVCVQKSSEAYAVGTVGYPDTSISFVYKPYTPGYINITVTCHNYFVYEDSCYVPQYAGFCWLYPDAYFVFDDSLRTYGKVNGNKDGILNPGETAQLYLNLANSGAYAGYYVIAKLRSNDTLISLIDSLVYYGNIAPGETIYKDTLSGDSSYFSIYLKPEYSDSTLDYHRISFSIFIEAFRDTSGKGGRHPQEWTYPLVLTEFCDSLVHSGQRVEIINDTVYLYPEISDLGGGSARGVYAILRGSPSSSIFDSVSILDEIKSLERKTASTDAFIYNNSVSDLHVIMRDYYGREWMEPLAVGAVSAPENLMAEPDIRAINLQWSWPGIPDMLAGFNIYRSQSDTGSSERINALLINGVSYYRDAGLQDWTKYFYKITAVDTSGNESGYTNVVSQYTQPGYQPGFPASVLPGAYSFGFYFSSPMVADMDNDTKKEIAVGAQGRVYVFDDNGEPLPGWPMYLGDYWICASPALADFNDDDTLELVIATGRWTSEADLKVHCLDIHGNELSGWPVDVAGPVFASPVIADIDGDLNDEILVVTREPAMLYAYRGDGTLVSGFPLTYANKFISQSPVVSDFDMDGKTEVFLQIRGSDHCELLLYRYDADSLKPLLSSGWPVTLDGDASVWPTHPAICDIDGDGNMNIIVVSRNPSTVRCYEVNGSLTWSYPVPSTDQIGGPGLGDLNGDGIIDILYAFYHTLYAISGDGQSILWTRELPFSGDWAQCSEGITVGDINCDLSPEILLSSRNWLWILNHDGAILEGSPFSIEGEGYSTPAITDIDNDSMIEVVGASGGDCKLKVWDLPYQLGKIEWPMC